MTKIVFLGTPLIAKYALETIYNMDGFDVIAVVSQPDRCLNRKKEIQYLEVKQYCLDKNITIYQPEKIIEIKEELERLKPDLLITCAYGQFIPTSILEIPTYGSYNFHASLLPKLRGGAPIHWAIINGEKETGWTLMRMVKKMDAGDFCAQKITKIDINETTETLYNKLCESLKTFIQENLTKLIFNDTKWIEQDEKNVTFGLNIKKENRIINFNKTCVEIDRLIRGLYPKPIAIWNNKNNEIKVFEAEISNIKSKTIPGTINKIDKKGIYISTIDNDIILKTIQLPNKNKVVVNQVYHNESFKKEII